ncbi:MAG TPA: TetR family transcriptional regulator [Saprospiraceae bacterium]|nr:TetR family transcriptional regulator [Saprospiraceae bacterium]
MTKSEKTRRMILEKAAALFNQKGIAGTSMNDIMEATGLTKGGLYGNFESKDKIAEAAFDYAVESVWREVSVRTKLIEHTLDKLKAVVYFYKERVFTPPVEGGCPIMNTAVEADNNHPALQKKVKEALDFWRYKIKISLEKGKEKGEVKPEIDSEEFATLFIATLEGGILLARSYNQIEPFNITSRHLINMIEQLRL